MALAKTIPTAWSPSPDCLASTDLWEWQRQSTIAHVLGGPVETSSCYPPGYTGLTSFYYEATACPTGFFPACGHADLRTTICCPTGYDFVCNSQTGYGRLDATTFPCTTRWSIQDTITFTYTQLGQTGDSVESYTVTRTSDSSITTFTTSGSFTTAEVVKSGGTLFAMAVAITPPTQTTSKSTTSSTIESHTAASTSTSPASPQTEPGGLSSAAAVGLGVGVAVGVLVLAASAFFVYHRSRKARQPSPTAGHGSQDAVLPQLEDVHRKPDLAQPVEMAVYERPGELHS